MRKSMTTMMMLMTSMLAFAACSSDGASKEAADVSANNDVPTEFQIQYTTPVPSEFFQTATKQGTIELVEYDSKDYTQSSRPATRKPAYVYVPYGYDPSEQYDVIYLLHGWTGVAEEYFLGRSGNSRTGLVNIFDNLIQRGLCRPFIAVSPTWDKDNRSKDWGESTREGSGLTDAISVIRQQEPQASVNATGFQTRGASAGSQSNAINEWLNGLGYK